ncbi:transposable element Tcb2 transposase [Trichonephila clavipes]|nr:transposable element Tcb2 transposase [Trichonephila clavipes]
MCAALDAPTPHRRLRLEWCRARGNWNAAEWNQVVFSDESGFNLSSDDNRVRVWRLRGERLNPPLLYSDIPLSQLMCWYGVPLSTIHGHP